jgi:hypothetical protein
MTSEFPSEFPRELSSILIPAIREITSAFGVTPIRRLDSAETTLRTRLSNSAASTRKAMPGTITMTRIPR